jgi:integrase
MPSFHRIDLEGVDDIYQDPKHGSYYLRIYLDWEEPKKRERFRTLGTRNLRQALERAKELRAEVARLNPEDRRRRYRHIAEECFDVKQRKNTNNRQSTVDQAEPIYQKYLISAFGDEYVESVTDARWSEQVAVWQAIGGRKTFENVRKYAVQVDRFAFNRGYKRFRNDFPIPKNKAREGIVLGDAELQVILDGCAHVYRDGKRLRPRKGVLISQGKRAALFVLLGRYCGMRRSEITQLTRDRIDLEEPSITLRPEDTKTGSKTGRGRKFAIAPEAIGALREACEGSDSPWLFPNRLGAGPVDKKSINRVMQRLAKSVAIAFRPHDLRHTFLTHKLFVERVDPMSVAIYAGVSLKVMQDVYLHPTVEDTRHVVWKQQNRKESESIFFGVQPCGR